MTFLSLHTNDGQLALVQSALITSVLPIPPNERKTAKVWDDQTHCCSYVCYGRDHNFRELAVRESVEEIAALLRGGVA